MVTQSTKQEVRTKYHLTTVYLYFSQYCNLRCRHCWIDPQFSTDKTLKEGDIDIKTLISALEECREIGVNSIKVTGGEPFLREDIFELLDYCKAKNLQITFETNGTLIGDKEAGALKEARVSQVAVSLDGPNASIHQALRGVEGSFDRTIESIKLLKKYNINTQIIISLWQKNKDYIKATIDLARSLGVNSVKINVISCIARADKLSQKHEVLGVREVIDFHKNLMEALKKEPPLDLCFDIPPAFQSSADASLKGLNTCGIHNILGILGNGKISICGIGTSVDTLVLGAIGQNSIKEIWNSHPILEEIRNKVPYKLEGVCGKCSFRYSCLGKCRAEAYYHKGNIVAPLSFCQRAYEEGLFPVSSIKEDLKSDRYITRNKCLIFYSHNGSVTTCLKDGQDYIKLEDFDLWLWNRLEDVDKLSIAEVESQAKSLGILKQSDNIERRIDELVSSNVLLYAEKNIEENRVNKDTPTIDDKKLNKYTAARDALFRELNTAKTFGKEEDLNQFHRNAIEAIDRHFEIKETTVSHLLRENNPVLGGLNYGTRLFEKINELKTVDKNTKILDIGAGLGFTSQAFLKSLKEYSLELADNIHYILCDLTFKFLESQRNLTKTYTTKFIQANAEALSFKDNSFDIIISNENMADFTSVKLNKKDVLDFLEGKLKEEDIGDALIRKALGWIASCSLDINDALPEFIFNLGAFEFMKQIHSVLKPGGLAFICEYGIWKGYPQAVPLVGHTEYSIQFSHLIKCIKSLGMEVEARPLMDLFDFNKQQEIADGCSLNFLYGILKKNNIDLPYLAYTKNMLEERIGKDMLYQFKNLRFIKIIDKLCNLEVNPFYVLLIRK